MPHSGSSLLLLAWPGWLWNAHMTSSGGVPPPSDLPTVLEAAAAAALGQMVPLPPWQYLRIKIDHPVLFSCCAN